MIISLLSPPSGLLCSPATAPPPQPQAVGPASGHSPGDVGAGDGPRQGQRRAGGQRLTAPPSEALPSACHQARLGPWVEGGQSSEMPSHFPGPGSLNKSHSWKSHHLLRKAVGEKLVSGFGFPSTHSLLGLPCAAGVGWVAPARSWHGDSELCDKQQVLSGHQIWLSGGKSLER